MHGEDKVAEALFRSTLPREERPTRFPWFRMGSGFDPRSRVRSDSTTWKRICSCWRFDPRSRVRSDAVPAGRRARKGRFDPRSRVRSDVRPFLGRDEAVGVSIHAPA